MKFVLAVTFSAAPLLYTPAASSLERVDVLSLSTELSSASQAPQSQDTHPDQPGFIRRTADRAGDLVMRALELTGISYRRGGASPETGFDCSGLVRYVFKDTLGLVLPHRAEDISRLAEKIPVTELRPGDLVFYNTMRRTFSHVGIYLGNGRFVHAPSSGKEVRVENMNMPYWTKRFNGARRVRHDT